MDKREQQDSMMTVEAGSNQIAPEAFNKWLNEVKTGTEAFDHIYDYFFPKIYNYILYRVGEQGIAEDMTSDTFIKVISKFDSFKGDFQAFTAWIYRIARNLITDYYRLAKRKAQVHFVSSEVLVSLTEKHTYEESPHEKMIKGDQMSTVREAINSLNPSDQEIITLKYFEGLENNTIAEILEVKPGTLNVRLHRIVEKLKEICNKQIQAPSYG